MIIDGEEVYHIGESLKALYKKYLAQRSSSAFTSFDKRDIKSNSRLGKTCIGVNSKGVYVIVQKHGSMKNNKLLNGIRDFFIEKKCKHAVFLTEATLCCCMRRANFLLNKQVIRMRHVLLE